jgi:hypothetical protein
VKASLIAACLGLVCLAGCRADTVELGYRFPDDGKLEYRLEAIAHAEWDIGERGRGSYEVVFHVTETLIESDGDEAVVEVVMSPTRVRESGLPSPGSEERSFTLRIDSTGNVVDVIEVQGVPAEQLDPTQVAFIGTYRPPLPRARQRLKDEWSDVGTLETESVSERVRSRGRLDALDRDDQGEFAELSFVGSGPLLYTSRLLQGQAELRGTSDTSIDAELDLGGGYLRRAKSSISGTFDVTVLPLEGAEPLEGELRLELELRLENLGD